MMSQIKTVDDTNFNTEVTNASGVVLVDFSATWCGPCKRQYPILEKFAEENFGKVKVVIVDIDNAPVAASKLGIRSVPSLLVFENGKQINFKVGLTTQAELNALLFEKLTKIG
jgi:thioredoxin 1